MKHKKEYNKEKMPKPIPLWAWLIPNLLALAAIIRSFI